MQLGIKTKDMNEKVIFLLALTILTLGCWFLATLFWGILNPGTLIALAIMVILIASILAPNTHRISQKIWMFAGFLTLISLFLPASFFLEVFPLVDAEPFSTSIALSQLLIISAALLISALIINSVLSGYSINMDEGEVVKTLPWILMILSLLLIAKAIYNFYWFLIWDSTTDSLGMIWLPIPVSAVVFASFIIFFARSEKTKTIGFLNLLFIPVLIAIFFSSQRVNYLQLTEDRAEHISLAIERYDTHESRYPQELSQLSPRYLLGIPAPVIIYGQDWCYDVSEGYYRLGYVYRPHWSDPHLIGKVYTSQGEDPQLPPLCEAEITALQQTSPDYSYEYLGDEK